MAGLSQYRLHLLAESVETREQFAACKALGFEYFQGNFFARPEPMAKRCLAPMELCVLTLVARLQNPQTCSDAVADAISVDVSLAHQILRIANSSAYYRGRDVTSILEAVVMLGHNVIRQWASLLLLSRLGVHKPSELLKIAVTRARLCQTLGSTHQELCCHELFTAGLLSVLDALFDQPMDDVLADLPLAASLKEALCGRPSGVLGEILRCAIDYGSGAWADAAVGDSSGQRIDMDTYLDAVEFADRALDVSG
jgi:EAL and modified HD-GYP domain-containing signal transduction protein